MANAHLKLVAPAGKIPTVHAPGMERTQNTGHLRLCGIRWISICPARPQGKAGTRATHPRRALRRLQRERGQSTHLFMSEPKTPIG